MTPTPREVRTICTYHRTEVFHGSLYDRPVVLSYRGRHGTGYTILRANDHSRHDNYIDYYIKPEPGTEHPFGSEA